MRKLDEIVTLVTTGDMTYVREVTEADFYNCICLSFQFDSICVFSVFVLTSKSFIEAIQCFKAYIYAATCVFLTRSFNVGAGYTFYPHFEKILLEIVSVWIHIFTQV